MGIYIHDKSLPVANFIYWINKDKVLIYNWKETQKTRRDLKNQNHLMYSEVIHNLKVWGYILPMACFGIANPQAKNFSLHFYILYFSF